MRILLDENIPIGCRHWFAGHDAQTVQHNNWKGVANGALLAHAIQNRFDVFLTADQAIQTEFDLDDVRRDIGFVILPTNSWPVLQRLRDEIVAAVLASGPGRFARLARPA